TNGNLLSSGAALVNGNHYYATQTVGGCESITRLDVTATLNSSVTPTVSIAITSGVNPTCSGSSVTFTATPTNGGTPSYQWQKGGVNVGTNSATYTDAGTAAGSITCVMTSSLSCKTSPTATSNAIALSVVQKPTASIVYLGNPFCTSNNATIS